jgi:acyl-coenzyme A synthetase/AMP-(fatty) acid ligase
VLKGSTTLSFEEISQKLSAILEFYKRPVAYDWIDKIPTTSSGKKQRLQIIK